MKDTLKRRSAIVDRLFELVRERGLSQREFSDRVGVYQGGMSGWARGLNVPLITNVEDMAQALGYEVRLVPAEEPDAIKLQQQIALLEKALATVSAMNVELREKLS